MTSDRLKLVAEVTKAELVLIKSQSVLKSAEAAIDFCKLTEQVYHRKLSEAKRALRAVA